MNTKSNLAKARKQEINKEKNMNNSRIETIKTIVLTALIAGIVAFIFGMHFEASNREKVAAEAANMVKSVKVEVQPAAAEPSKK